MVKPQPRAVACAGWFQRRVSPDPAPPPRFQPDVVVGAVGVIVTIVATVLMAIADLKTDLKADITSLKTDLKTDIKALPARRSPSRPGWWTSFRRTSTSFWRTASPAAAARKRVCCAPGQSQAEAATELHRRGSSSATSSP
ncbi:hypothetical protein CHLRE_17g719701v5 [Chlamydomonas reinhardtii]|uniref:Uncharacterized protein n=1 Tax=Chlamydomonas reinhardtii TaxID=3055 RepID=A0A2K3CQ90_CHLRE|nr:uncharacterized protein CHLRE_17g719701v5 [Chlamydomonas reinhardtii]PNW70433.1 hypothetical protein CHLRE_17g719701v5 [Chlamydomonas reinhardtii]